MAPGVDVRVVNADKVAEQASTSDGLHIHDVQHQQKNNLLSMRMPRRKYVWNESNIEPKQPPLLLINQCFFFVFFINQCFSIFQVRLNLFPFFFFTFEKTQCGGCFCFFC